MKKGEKYCLLQLIQKDRIQTRRGVGRKQYTRIQRTEEFFSCQKTEAKETISNFGRPNTAHKEDLIYFKI